MKGRDQVKLEKTATVLKYAALSAWYIWLFLSMALLLNAGSESSLIYLYLVYLLFGTVVLIFVRKDVLSPPGIFTLLAFVGFGFNIPLIAAGLTPEIRIPSATLVKVLIVLLCAQGAFMAGYLVRLHKLMPTGWIVNLKGPSREAGIASYVLIACYVVAAAIIRSRYHLGEAGIQPKISLAGYVQYVLHEGLLILCLWYLSRGLEKGRMYVLLGLSLLLGMAGTQALLAWRGGVGQVLVLAVILFWYQKKVYEKRKVRSLVWLLLPLILVTSIMELGNTIRVRRLGGDYQFTQEHFARKVLLRGQGTTRLAKVVDYFGPITFENHFLIENLWAKGLTTTKYIDQEVYGVAPRQSNSFGTSGPGGPYTAMGLIGVFVAYGLLGAFYRSVHENIFVSKTGGFNSMGVVFYALLAYTLLGLLNENFNLNSIKAFIAIGGQIYVYKFVLYKRQKVSEAHAGRIPGLVLQKQLRGG